MPGKKWTPERELILKELAKKGTLNASEIGYQLGVSRDSVIGKMQRLGITSIYVEQKSRRIKEKNITKRFKVTRHESKPDMKFMNHPSFHSPTPTSRPLSEIHNECLWCVQDKPKLFCGEPIHKGHYCKEHYQIAYKKVSLSEAQKNPVIPFLDKLKLRLN